MSISQKRALAFVTIITIAVWSLLMSHARKVSDNTLINLDSCYRWVQFSKTLVVALYPSGGMFVQLTDKTVIFFSNEQFAQIKDAFWKNTSVSLRCLHYDCASNRSKSILANFGQVNGIFCANGVPISVQSLERLHLCRGWDKVYQRKWNIDCTISHLGNGKFLIAGGGVIPNPPGAAYATDECFIYDADRDVIEKQLKMCTARMHANAVVLGDGNVLMIGGTGLYTDALDSLELYDCKSQSFRLLKCHLTEHLVSANACLLNGQKVILLGGSPLYEAPDFRWSDSIKLIDVESETIQCVGRLTRQRVFHGAGRTRVIDGLISSVEEINGDKVLVSGGEFTRPVWYADFANGWEASAEIIPIQPSSP